MTESTLVLGASSNPDRYSNIAIKKLQNAGYHVIAVSPKGGEIEGIKVVKDLEFVKDAVDTVTIYINPSLLDNQIEKIITLNPRRVIFNPGTEHPIAMQKFAEQAIKVVQNCTLVMLDNKLF